MSVASVVGWPIAYARLPPLEFFQEAQERVDWNWFGVNVVIGVLLVSLTLLACRNCHAINLRPTTRGAVFFIGLTLGLVFAIISGISLNEIMIARHVTTPIKR